MGTINDQGVYEFDRNDPNIGPVLLNLQSAALTDRLASDNDRLEALEEGGGGRLVGEIVMYYGPATAPPGWLLCDGGSVNSVLYPELYALIGANTPDFRDRSPVGASTSKAVGATGGSATTSIPSHSHTVSAHTHSFSATTSSFSHAQAKNTQGGGSADRLMRPIAHNHTVSGTTGSGGGGNTGSGGAATVNTLDPWIGMHFLIRAE